MPNPKKPSSGDRNLEQNLSKLQKENNELRDQVAVFNNELSKMKDKMASLEDDPSSIERSIQHFSDEYDDFRLIKDSLKTDIDRMSCQLRTIEANLNNVEKAVEEMCKYSYQYNLKIFGLSKANPKETAMQTMNLCVKLFKEIGADVSLQDIDIAHRVTPRDPKKTPPIICKFTRRIAKEDVMSCKGNLREVNFALTDLKTEGRVNIYDHLTPKAQMLFNQTKKFQMENNFKYCWTKNSTILLRESDDSDVIKVINHDVLQKLSTSFFTSHSDFTMPSNMFGSNRGRGSGRGGGNSRPRRSTANYGEDN